jgi:hypothetical protein
MGPKLNNKVARGTRANKESKGEKGPELNSSDYRFPHGAS